MALDGLKDQLREQWAELSSKIQETTAFNTAREKFEGQSSTVQRAIIAGIAFLVFLFLVSFPWGYISTSQEHLVEFEENRSLIQGLLHASRAAKEPSPLPTPVSSDQIRGQVEMILKENRLLPDQIGEMKAMPANPSKDLAPAVVIQNGLAVQLKRLNLDQMVNLSVAFQNLGPGYKLMGVDVVQSATQTHYYDMIVRIVHFALPAVTAVEDTPDEPKKGGKKPPKPHKADDEGSVE